MGLRVESRSHVVLERWMISELGLHGNKLITYAIIYGCSLAGNQEFTASINYFCEWMGISRSQVLSILKDLEIKKLLVRKSKVKGGITYNSYRAVIPVPSEDKKDIPEDFMTPPEDLDDIPYKAIIDYLNEKLGSNYRSSAERTKKYIRARWREKYSLDDFYAVIDGRIKAWKYDRKMSSYLRPETLFGTKFESYLQAANSNSFTELGDDNPVLDENGKPKEY